MQDRTQQKHRTEITMKKNNNKKKTTTMKHLQYQAMMNNHRHAEKYSRRLFGWTETCILPGFHGNLFLELDATANVSHYNIP